MFEVLLNSKPKSGERLSSKTLVFFLLLVDIQLINTGTKLILRDILIGGRCINFSSTFKTSDCMHNTRLVCNMREFALSFSAQV
jgi:hypothetical protein